MRYLILSAMILACQAASAQVLGGKKLPVTSVEIDNVQVDVGDTVKLHFGTGMNGDFVFVSAHVGRGLISTYVHHVNSQYSNTRAVVDHFRDYGLGPVPILFSTMAAGKKVNIVLVPNWSNAIMKGEISLVKEVDQGSDF